MTLHANRVFRPWTEMMNRRTVFSAGTVLALVTIVAIGLHAQQPAAPSSLAVDVTGTTVSLRWEPSPAGVAAQYIIEVGTMPGASNLGRFNVGSTTLVVANDVAAGTRYVRVRASTGAIESAPSNEVVFTVGASTTCTTAPAAPGALTSSVDGVTVQLSWGAAPGVTTYVIEVGSTTGASNLATFDLGTTNTSHRAVGVAGGTYFVRVRGRNACGLGPPSNDAVVVVGVQVPSSGPPRIEIVNAQEITNHDGVVYFFAEVVNTGGTTASKMTRNVDVFRPDGSRAFGTLSEVSGRTRRLLNSNELGHSTLAPGESGCISERLGRRAEVGRYEVRTTVGAEPTAPALGQLQVEGSWYVNNAFGLVVGATLTNVGQTRTVDNWVRFMAKDAGGRVVMCGRVIITGRTFTPFPGFLGTVSQLVPGERTQGGMSFTDPFRAQQMAALSIAELRFWPRWLE